MKRVSLREFNRHRAAMIASVENGATIELTRRGRAIARLVPIRKRDAKAAKQRSIARMLAHFDKVAASVKDGPPYQFDREEIYEERIARYGRKSVS